MKLPKYIVTEMQQLVNLGLNGFALGESFADDPEKFKGENVIFRPEAHNGQAVYFVMTKEMPTAADFEPSIAVVPPVTIDHPEICICAAIRMPDGEVIRGHRHNHCYEVVRVRVGAIYRREDIVHAEQGFVTSLNRFVGREEAMRLQREAGIPSAFSLDGVLRGDILFSEDLYGEPATPATEAPEGEA